MRRCPYVQRTCRTDFPSSQCDHRAFLRAGLVDQLHVAITPILLGRGDRLWDDLRGLELTHSVTSEVSESGIVHVTFAR
jgi:dihydrofolate reductase